MKKYLIWVGVFALLYGVMEQRTKAAEAGPSTIYTFEEIERELNKPLEAETSKSERKKPEWEASKKHQRTELYLSAILLGECRGQGAACMTSVGHVAMNRARLNMDTRYGKGLIGVIKKRKQFSCLNKNDPSYPLLMKAIAGNLDETTADGIAWKQAKEIAHHLMHVGGKDPTGSATHYYAEYVSPAWKNDRGMVQTVKISGHIFYRKEG